MEAEGFKSFHGSDKMPLSSIIGGCIFIERTLFISGSVCSDQLGLRICFINEKNILKRKIVKSVNLGYVKQELMATDHIPL